MLWKHSKNFGQDTQIILNNTGFFTPLQRPAVLILRPAVLVLRTAVLNPRPAVLVLRLRLVTGQGAGRVAVHKFVCHVIFSHFLIFEKLFSSIIKIKIHYVSLTSYLQWFTHYFYSLIHNTYTNTRFDLFLEVFP